MLERLRICNFALIDELELSFEKGLNVLTGETGAGKSILLGALSVVLGERITPELFRSTELILEIEASFSTSGLALPVWIKDREDVLLIVRTAEKDKRVQNFVNQRQTTQNSLVELGEGLVDIHGQHQHQLLLKSSTHGQFLDAYGGLDTLREQYASRLSDYENLLSRIHELKTDLKQRREQKDFLEFQLEEIAKLNPQPGESEELKKEREFLASAEQRSDMAARLINLISEQEEASILEGLSIANQLLDDLTKIDPSVADSLANLRQAEISAEETWRALVGYKESIEYSPERLEEINQRLFNYERLCRKHYIDEQGLIKLRDELKNKLDSIEIDAEEIKGLEKQEQVLRDEIINLAVELSQARLKTKETFEQALNLNLEGLAMPKAGLVVEFVRIEDPEGLYEEAGRRYKLTDKGLETAQFLFSANPGEEPKPLNRIASGGELSRIMLALKTVLVKSDQVPVLVFDEIDVGIGGSTAETIGKRLKELASSKQILLVTHLPQIARYADCHFRVEKEVTDGRTATRIEKLDHQGRIDELARMLGGEEITETVRAHAVELLEGRE
ncbi:DNA repair protein RecN [candidate division WOR-3 bacterium]|nr:DNA repair protein RecN [candidate division WOR-3 bacterium]